MICLFYPLLFGITTSSILKEVVPYIVITLRILVFNFSNGHNQKVHMHMVDLMSSIICEGDTVSQELLDTVLVNLVPAHKVRLRGLCFVLF